ncbi:MAG TPA: AMP-binding protein [Micromonosporaceae bacterium]|nr:AMP-binding protein [Micromonosporaceae bacterium]
MDVPDNPDQSYVRRALDRFEKYGDEEAIVAGEDRITYTDLRAAVLRMAGTLTTQGLAPGSALGILVGNPYEAPYLQFGAHLLGFRTCWVAWNAPVAYQADFLRLAQVDAFVYDPRMHAELGQRLARALPELPAFCLGPGGVGPDLLAAGVDRTVEQLPAVTTEPESLFQTGGTTGRPKLVHHGHTFFRTMMAMSDAYLAGGEPRLRHLALSGYWHVSGQVPAMMTLFTGGTFYPEEYFDAGDVLSLIEREQITSVLLTPPLFYLVLDHPKLAETDTSSLDMVSVSGSATAPARLAQGIERLGPVLRLTYGTTEFPFITALSKLGSEPGHAALMGSCGRPQPYSEVLVEIRNDAGEVLPAGETGEVWVAGGLNMRGYWGEPELTAQTVVDGWFRTGDVGYLDANGYLFLVDRVRDIIITGWGSTNVYSRPIEDVLLSHPHVHAAAVVGVPDNKWGEKVHAFVVPVPDAQVTAEELRELVMTELNAKWAPQRVEIVDELPLTNAGKVDKKALRAAYLARTGG